MYLEDELQDINLEKGPEIKTWKYDLSQKGFGERTREGRRKGGQDQFMTYHVWKCQGKHIHSYIEYMLVKKIKIEEGFILEKMAPYHTFWLTTESRIRELFDKYKDIEKF